MWRRTLAKYGPSKKLKFPSNSTNLHKDSIFIDKFRSPDTKTCRNFTFSLAGYRQLGILPRSDKLGNPSFTNLTNPFGVSSYLVKGYATAAAQMISSTDESELSGSDDVQGLLEEVDRHYQKMEAHFRPQEKKMVAGMGIGKYTMLKKRQVKIETEAWEQAAQEYQEMLTDMCEQKLAPNLPYMKSLFLGWFEPLRDAIVADQEFCRNNIRAYGPYINELPADMMAVITMHKLMGLLMTGSGGAASVRVVQAACAVGEAIEHEVNELRI